MKKQLILTATVLASLSTAAYTASAADIVLGNNHSEASHYNLVTGPGNNRVNNDNGDTTGNVIAGGWMHFKGRNVHNLVVGTDVTMEKSDIGIVVGDAVKSTLTGYNLMVGNHITNTNTEDGSKKFGTRSTMIKGDYINVVDSPFSSTLGRFNEIKNAYGTLTNGYETKVTNASFATVLGVRNTVDLSEDQQLKGPVFMFGTDNYTNNNHTITMGSNIKNTGKNAIALGNFAEVSGTQGFAVYGNAKGKLAISIGTESAANDMNGVAIGAAAVSDKVNGIAIGTFAKSSEISSIAIGRKSEASGQGSVALGDSSKAGDAVSTPSAVINGKTYTFAGGNPTVGTVSVGDVNKERTITNVAAGRISSTSTDAINGSQLNAVVEELGNSQQNNYSALNSKIDSYNTSSKKGIAGAGALAALHLLDFNPDYKLDIMAGYGNYKGTSAAAIGLAYRPNEDLMFTAGSTITGGKDNVFNAGVSYKVGAHSDVSRSKVSVAKDVADMKKEIQELKAHDVKVTAILNAVLGLNIPEEQSVMFPDVEKNHWAYEAVNDLANRGLLTGYPDGTFKGDSNMTRYEFAMIVERAIQRAKELNQSIDARLVDEFKPELLRFEIQKNGSLERVHTLKSTKDLKRDNYGTIITK